MQSQILDSMLKCEVPNRQEMSEITTACLDGADGFILSHETSNGKYFIESTINLAKSIAEAENIYDHEQAFINNRKDIMEMGDKATNVDVLCTTSCTMAFDKDADVDIIVCLTENGKIARFLSKQRTRQPILACSTCSTTVRQVNAFRGVVGYKIPQHLAMKHEDLLDLLLKVAQE